MGIDQIRRSYDAVAQRYAREYSGELAGKPVDRALLGCLVDLVGRGPAEPDRRIIGDVGCGAGHITGFLAALGAAAVGVDLSPAMIAEASRRHPGLHFTVGSILDLPVPRAAWSGAVCAYSIIHLTEPELPVAYAELARVVAPGGWLLVAFHVSDAERGPGSAVHVGQWWGQSVDLDFHYLDPDLVARGLDAAGWRIQATTLREPSGPEYPSRRAYLLARHGGVSGGPVS